MQVSTISVLLLQIILILALSRLLGMLAARIGQPRVVGEMLAGIILGPSLLGWLAPDVWAFIFPPNSIRMLNVLAQIGVIFFLFLIGLELDPELLRKRGRAALVISWFSIIIPFVSGAALTLLLYPLVFNDTPQMRFTAVALFMGAAMSVTAFPVLARILAEHGLQKTSVGMVALTCAAVVDVVAWCMLAFVFAIGRAEGLVPGLITLGLSAVYITIMFLLVRPLLRGIAALHERQSQSAQMVLAIVLLLTLLSAAATEWIGIHALFGAFLMGAIMPTEHRFVRFLTERLEDFTVIFLLPVFFAYAGLRTQIGLLDNPYLWGLTGLVILVACAGKFGGSALAARAAGMNWRESSAIGILMNTRGLVELVILTIGLQMGVITDAVFAMVVLMALVTTAMTTPILRWVYPRKLLEAEVVREEAAPGQYTVLIPISRPDSAPGLVRIASLLTGGAAGARILGLTLYGRLVNETLGVPVRSADDAASRALHALRQEAGSRQLEVEPVIVASRDFASDIGRVARSKHADLILMGHHKALFGEAILGGVVHRVLTGTDADVAILVDRGLGHQLRILVPYQGTPHDRLAVDLVRRMASAPGLNVTILHVVAAEASGVGAPSIRKQKFPDSVEMWVVEDACPEEAVLRHSGEFDMVVLGLSEEWGFESSLFGTRAERIAEDWPGSLLLVRKHAAGGGRVEPLDWTAAQEMLPGRPGGNVGSPATDLPA